MSVGNPVIQPNRKFIARHGKIITISIELYSCLIRMNNATRTEYTVRLRVARPYHAKSVLLLTADVINKPMLE